MTQVFESYLEESGVVDDSDDCWENKLLWLVEGSLKK